MSRGWKIALGIMGGVAGLLFVGLALASVYISKHARDTVDDYLTHEFKSDVELNAFRVAIAFPLVQCDGDDLVLHFQGRQDLPPLIAIKHFTLRASFMGFLRNPIQVEFVHLDGLQLNIPPKGEKGSSDKSGIKKAMGRFRDVRFGEILTENTTLKILTNKPGKDPLTFDLSTLKLYSTGNGSELAFNSTLRNPTPPGDIVSNGKFGPWNADEPRETPVSGEYTFNNADLGHFHGIGGILSSVGKYDGALARIHVNGTTDVPDFRVNRAGHPVHLTTTFDATVDGTDGDTYLHPVVAKFGKTTFTAEGSVEGTTGKKGKTVTLDVDAKKADIEDFLHLAVKDTAPMKGPIRMQTKFILMPGPQEIPDRLKLDGFFELDSVYFTSATVQQKVDDMSKRSEGKPKEIDKSGIPLAADDVASEMKGKFKLSNGTLAVSQVGFLIPGASIHIDGTYDMKQANLDFAGIVELDAKLSQTMTGAKSFFLKILDPFFSKNGKGTVLPIKITGPIKHPHYGLDLHRKKQEKGSGKDLSKASN